MEATIRPNGKVYRPALTAERRVARVQALCDDPGALYYGEDGELSALLANDVRAALDGTQ
jgi:hypothetical protein